MRNRRFRLLRMRNSYSTTYFAQKRTEETAGFEPSTLSMPRMPMRYDALDRSTTTAGLEPLILNILEE